MEQYAQHRPPMLHNYFNQIFGQLEELLDQLDAHEYTLPLPILSGASIGKHHRHTIEAFQAVVDGARTGTVSFDKRKRDVRLERDKDFALQSLQNIGNSLQALSLSEPIELICDFAYDDTGEATHSPSSLEREFIYALEHAIHHMAIMKIGAIHSFDTKLSPEFGVAPSSIRFMRTQM